MPHPVGPVAPSAPAPDGARGAPVRLPWPEGALLPATIERAHSPSSMPARATLSLPGMTLTASLPPNIPLPPSGTIWLQLLDRSMPARFRLLTLSEATRLVSEALERLMRATTPAGSKASSTNVEHPASTSTHNAEGQAPTAHRAPDWPLNLTGVPWHARTEKRHLALHDEAGEERGVLLREAGAKGFRLFGRLDLAHLGAVLFQLTGTDDNAENWSLTIHATNASGMASLRRALPDWLRQQDDARRSVRARLTDTWPEDEGIRGEHRA